ncbi:MAG: prolyl oligopeptidase family serine peptidase [Pseudomonadales bacterium]|jgi:dipeptidyl-peptidase-4|nr:prolyl oligopeptidase family serine peptidase [Pseudomonadales bacterium]
MPIGNIVARSARTFVRDALTSGFAVLSALISTALGAEPDPELSLEALLERPGIFGTAPAGPAWSPDGAQLAFRWAEPGEGRRGLWLVAASGENLRRIDQGAANAPAVREIAWSADGGHLLSLRGDQLWQSDPAGGGEAAMYTVGAGAGDLKVSPDGRYVSYLRDGDLWLFDLRTQRERALTAVGLPPLSEPPTGRYSRPEREIGPGIWGGPTYAWSPDGARIALHHVDRRGMRRVPFPNYLAEETDPNPVRRGYPGDPNEARHVGLLGVEDGELTLLELDEPESFQIVGFDFSKRGDLLVDTASDTATDRRLYTLAAGSTVPELLWESRRETRIYTSFAARWVAAGDAVVLLSDHEDRYGLYRLAVDQDGAGTLRRLDDPADDVLSEPKFAGDALYFEANAESPADRHVFRLDPGAAVAEQLTRTPGQNVAFPAPRGGAVAILHEDDRHPRELFMLSAGDATPRRVTHSPAADFDDFPLAEVRYLQTPAGGSGPPLHVRLMLPADFDADRRYPVLFGPMYSNTVRNRWGSSYALVQQLMTQRGYLVVQVDVPGSTGYGRAFREVFLNDFAGGDIEAIERVVAYLKTLPYVDGDRLGIWGSSYGGTLTVYTLLKKPGLFAAGVAAAAAVDPAFFGTDDVAIVGRPEDGTGIFERRAEDLVDRLEDALLLVHGLQDQVVPFKTAAALTDAFIRAGKDVETAFLPAATHGWSREPGYARYGYQRLLDFFDRHLQPGEGDPAPSRSP